MNKLQSAQLAYDNRTPDESPEPLELIEVQNWIESEAATLLAGRDVKLGSRIIVHAYELSDIVAAEAVRRYTEGEDQDGMLGQLILAALDYEPAKACGCALSLFGADKEWCDQAAIELLEPHAADILAQIVEDNRDDF
jgi:hypothetical protein